MRQITMEPTGRTELAQRICEAVAEETDTDVLALPPLYEAIDPDALEAFLDSPDGTAAHPTRRITFTYEGYLVTVDATGQVQLQPDTGTDTG